ncbi:MAG: hypothetical protein NVS3B25_14000 [Hymenobacter sp.]
MAAACGATAATMLPLGPLVAAPAALLAAAALLVVVRTGLPKAGSALLGAGETYAASARDPLAAAELALGAGRV